MVLLMFLVLFGRRVRPGGPSPAAPCRSCSGSRSAASSSASPTGCCRSAVNTACSARERFAGVGATAYVLAKVAVLLPLLALVDLLFMVVLRVLGRLPAAGTTARGVRHPAAVLGGGARARPADLGGGLRAVPGHRRAADGVLPAGAVRRRLPAGACHGPGRPVDQLRDDEPVAFEALGNSMGVAALWATGWSALGTPLLASYGTTFGRAVFADWLILAGFTVAFLAVTVAIVVRKSAVAGRRSLRRRVPSPAAQALVSAVLSSGAWALALQVGPAVAVGALGEVRNASTSAQRRTRCRVTPGPRRRSPDRSPSGSRPPWSCSCAGARRRAGEPPGAAHVPLAQPERPSSPAPGSGSTRCAAICPPLPHPCDARSSITCPSRSRKLSETVPPRRSMPAGPYTRTSGAPSPCLSLPRWSRNAGQQAPAGG